jgi:ATP-dependent DNA helicase RecQ
MTVEVPKSLVATASERAQWAYAQAIAGELGIPYIPLIVAKPTLSEQSRMTNQLLRAANTYTGYEIRDECHGKQIILFDDYVDSGWSMTTAAFLLQKKGSGTVHPFAFALKGRRGTGVH